MPNLTDQLADDMIEHGIDLLRVAASANRRVQLILNGLQDEIVGRLAKADLSAGNRARLESVLRDVRIAIQQGYGAIDSAIERDLSALVPIEANATAVAVNRAVGVSIMEGALPRGAATELMRDTLIAGAPSSEWWLRQARDLTFRFTAAIRTGMLQGETNSQLISRVRGATGILAPSRRAAEALVRTSVQTVANSARLASMRANGDIVKGVQQISTLDDRTSDVCFFGSTPVQPIGAIRRVFARPYNGDVVVITTASGKQLDATPNHPILTARGWRPFEEVEPTKDVVYRVSGDGLCIECRERVGMPAPIGAIADALREPAISDITVKRASPQHFHGDAVAGEYEVYAPRAERDLRNALMLATQLVEHDMFSGGYARGALPRQRSAFQHRRGWSPAADSPEVAVVATENLVETALAYREAALDFDGPGAFQEGGDDLGLIVALGCLPAPEGGHYASALEQIRRGGCGHVVVACDCCGRLAVHIAADDVVAVRREARSGHVYNLSTDSRLYIAGGFLVHNCIAYDGATWDLDGKPTGGNKLPFVNEGGADGGVPRHWNCRSILVPITKTWKDLGVDAEEFKPSTRAAMDGTVAAQMGYAEWLKRQSNERQDAILGKGKAALYRAGRITTRDLLDQSGRPLTLAELQAKHGD